MYQLQIETNIHDSDFFTFETSWIGEEFIDFTNEKIYIPLVNLDVQNADVLKYFSVERYSSVYIEQCFFYFDSVFKFEKQLSIHEPNKKGFKATLNDCLKFENTDENKKVFELGGMGVFKQQTFDGIFKVHALNCFLVIPNNESYRLEYKNMSNYNPTQMNWLNSFEDELINKKIKV